MAEVSIIIVCRDAAAFIETALQSALDAPLPDAEIVVVDNASRAAARRRIESVIRRNPKARIRPLHLARRMPDIAAAEIGLGAARGAIVAFLDGHDWLSPEALARAAATLAASGDDFLALGHEVFDGASGELRAGPDAARLARAAMAPTPDGQRRALLRCGPMLWGKICQRRFLLDARFPTQGDGFAVAAHAHHWRCLLSARDVGVFEAPTHVRRARPPRPPDGAAAIRALFACHDRIRADLIARDQLTAHETALAGWLLTRIARRLGRIDPMGLYALFDGAAERLALIDPARLDAATARRRPPPGQAMLFAALLAGDRSGFAGGFLDARRMDGGAQD